MPVSCRGQTFRKTNESPSSRIRYLAERNNRSECGWEEPPPAEDCGNRIGFDRDGTERLNQEMIVILDRVIGGRYSDENAGNQRPVSIIPDSRNGKVA
jgi:hypothetical protein